MHPDLEGTFLKIGRARYHLETLRAEIEAFERQEPFGVEKEVTEGGRAITYRLRVIMEPYHRWAAIVGDCAHNLRSALDHVACRLVEMAGNKPTRRTQFPICTTRPPNGLTVSGGVTPEALEALDRLQPYNRPDPRRHQLALLHRIDITDKHKELLLAALAVDHAWWGLGPGEEGPLLGGLMHGVLRDGDIAAKFVFAADQPVIDLDAHFQIHVALADVIAPRPETQPSLLNLLDSLLWQVEHQVIDRTLAHLFPER